MKKMKLTHAYIYICMYMCYIYNTCTKFINFGNKMQKVNICLFQVLASFLIDIFYSINSLFFKSHYSLQMEKKQIKNKSA